MLSGRPVTGNEAAPLTRRLGHGKGSIPRSSQGKDEDGTSFQGGETPA